jgi:hypothetical protein
LGVVERKKKQAPSATYDCPKQGCGRKAWKPDTVERRGKDPAKVFRYLRYRHPKLYGRYRVCYVRVQTRDSADDEEGV